MYEGWLWLSILKMIASPSPMSMTPAFSPGPQITRGPLIGNFFSWFFEDLYEQCSDHMTENTPNSTRLGSRPRRFRTTSYSAGFRPNSAANSAMGFWGVLMGAPSNPVPGIPPHSSGLLRREARAIVATARAHHHQSRVNP